VLWRKCTPLSTPHHPHPTPVKSYISHSDKLIDTNVSRTATLCSILHDYTNRHLGFIRLLWVRGFLNGFHKSPILQSSLYLFVSVPSPSHLPVISFVSSLPYPAPSVPAILLRSHFTDGSVSQGSQSVLSLPQLTHFARTRCLSVGR
jgi:hypothetical protein